MNWLGVTGVVFAAVLVALLVTVWFTRASERSAAHNAAIAVVVLTLGTAIVFAAIVLLTRMA